MLVDSGRNGDFNMNETQQIIYMQVRLIRLASEEWNQPVDKTAILFYQYGVLQYIEECFGMFHVEGDRAILEDIKMYLKNKGITDDTGINK